MADADRFFISEMDGELVGGVRLALEEGALVLRGMRVRADMQRRGIGTRLLQML
jgi:N-acetylglutamate synthase-like GNAT family acetyltransferase